MPTVTCTVIHMYCTLYRAKFSVKHVVSNLKYARCYMSLDTVLHSQVIKVVEEPYCSVSIVGVAYLAVKAFKAILLDPNCIMAWWR